MLGVLNAYHFRMLCESPMNGGGGYLPSQIGEMSLDQIWFRLCDTEILKRKTGFNADKMSSVDVKQVLEPDKDGLYKGRDVDGRPIKARMGGKSLNRILMEQAEAEAAKKRLQDKRHKRREKR